MWLSFTASQIEASLFQNPSASELESGTTVTFTCVVNGGSTRPTRVTLKQGDKVLRSYDYQDNNYGGSIDDGYNDPDPIYDGSYNRSLRLINRGNNGYPFTTPATTSSTGSFYKDNHTDSFNNNGTNGGYNVSFDGTSYDNGDYDEIGNSEYANDDEIEVGDNFVKLTKVLTLEKTDTAEYLCEGVIQVNDGLERNVAEKIFLTVVDPVFVPVSVTLKSG